MNNKNTNETFKKMEENNMNNKLALLLLAGALEGANKIRSAQQHQKTAAPAALGALSGLFGGGAAARQAQVAAQAAQAAQAARRANMMRAGLGAAGAGALGAGAYLGIPAYQDWAANNSVIDAVKNVLGSDTGLDLDNFQNDPTVRQAVSDHLTRQGAPVNRTPQGLLENLRAAGFRSALPEGFRPGELTPKPANPLISSPLANFSPAPAPNFMADWMQSY